MKPNIPEFPPNRTIKHNNPVIFGFEIHKVKHYFWVVIYVISLWIGFIFVLTPAIHFKLFEYWYLLNIFLIGVILFINGIKYLIKKWNKPV